MLFRRFAVSPSYLLYYCFMQWARPASLARNPVQVYVEDMSANGTWINQDMKLVRGQRRLLHSGDEISLLNPYKHQKRTAAGGSSDKEAERGAGAESGRETNDAEKLEAEAATFTFINLNRSVSYSSCTTSATSAFIICDPVVAAFLFVYRQGGGGGGGERCSCASTSCEVGGYVKCLGRELLIIT